MNHFICDACESVRACGALGCRPLQTRDGGESIDTEDCTSESAFSAFALLRYALIAIASAFACAFVGGVIARWMAH